MRLNKNVVKRVSTPWWTVVRIAKLSPKNPKPLLVRGDRYTNEVQGQKTNINEKVSFNLNLFHGKGLMIMILENTPTV